MNKALLVNYRSGFLLLSVIILAFEVQAQVGDGNPEGLEDESSTRFETFIPERFLPTGPAQRGSSEFVYFAPQDNSSNVTVISLFSTSNSDQNVRLETFRLDGTALVDETVLVPAGQMVRISSDLIVDPPPGDWSEAIFIQFFNTSALARLTLPPGIEADAYVAWTNTLDYDPRQAVATFDLRFNSELQ